jgi:RNA processing factor Prp31
MLQRVQAWRIEVAFGSGCAVLLLIASCQPTSRQQYQRRLADTGKPALHAVHDERLRELMGRLQGHMSNPNLPQEFDTTRGTESQAAEIQKVAAALAATAGDIPDYLPELKLTDAEKEEFRKLAEKLGTQARTLEAEARDRSVPAMNRTLNRINTTCNACHSLFREFPS